MKKIFLILIFSFLWCNIGIAVEKDEYIVSADIYTELVKKSGINVKSHIVMNSHGGPNTLIPYGKDIIREALKN